VRIAFYFLNRANTALQPCSSVLLLEAGELILFVQLLRTNLERLEATDGSRQDCSPSLCILCFHLSGSANLSAVAQIAFGCVLERTANACKIVANQEL
jgi:hypothetical protein